MSAGCPTDVMVRLFCSSGSVPVGLTADGAVFGGGGGMVGSVPWAALSRWARLRWASSCIVRLTRASGDGISGF